MTTEREFAELGQRAAEDSDLRRQLMTDLLDRARALGITLSDEQLSELESPAFITLPEEPEGMDQRISKSALSPTVQLLVRLAMQMRIGLGGRPGRTRLKRK